MIGNFTITLITVLESTFNSIKQKSSSHVSLRNIDASLLQEKNSKELIVNYFYCQRTFR